MRTTIMVLGLVVLLGAACSPRPPVKTSAAGAVPAFAGDVNLAAKVAVAKTAADHEAIAADYATQAAEAKGQAERHDKMAKSYLGKLGQFHADRHCAAIAKRYREQAKDLEALAEAHRAEAKRLGT